MLIPYATTLIYKNRIFKMLVTMLADKDISNPDSSFGFLIQVTNGVEFYFYSYVNDKLEFMEGYRADLARNNTEAIQKLINNTKSGKGSASNQRGGWTLHDAEDTDNFKIALDKMDIDDEIIIEKFLSLVDKLNDK